MQVRQTLYPQGSGEIKMVRIDEDIVTVFTRHDGERVYRRDKNPPTTNNKSFGGERIIPAKEGMPR